MRVRALVIHNPAAGARTEPELIPSAVSVFESAGWEVRVAETHASGDALRLARGAAEQDEAEAVFAMGGDGTVNEVLNGLVGSRVALGVLPYGTGNVWAKEMGLPLGDLAEAARLQTQARVRRVDVGEARGEAFGPRCFVLWCGVGFDAAIAADIEPQRAARRRFGPLIWFLSGLRLAFSFRGRIARVRIDGRQRRLRLLMGLASNAQLYGRLVKVSPTAQVDDGAIDLALFLGTGAWRTGWHLVRVALGWHLRAPDVKHYRAREIEIRGKGLPVHVDAEPIGVTPVRITVRPGALAILCPPQANASLFQNAAADSFDSIGETL